MRQMETLRELFEHELQDIYAAERMLVEALPQMAAAAADDEGEKAFQDHLVETRQQIQRLERVAAEAGIRLEGRGCPGMEGLLREHQALREEQPDDELLGLSTLWAGQKVERYEMTAYEMLVTLAEELGMDAAAEQLTATLDEEEAALSTLKELAEEFDTSGLSAGEEEEGEGSAAAAAEAEDEEVGEDQEVGEAPARRH